MAKSERIEIRVSLEEKAAMLREAEKHDVNLSKWVRVRLLGLGELYEKRMVVARDPGTGGSKLVEAHVADVAREGPLRPVRSEPSLAKPWKCPACSWRTENMKASCPTHRRPVVAG